MMCQLYCFFFFKEIIKKQKQKQKSYPKKFAIFSPGEPLLTHKERKKKNQNK